MRGGQIGGISCGSGSHLESVVLPVNYKDPRNIYQARCSGTCVFAEIVYKLFINQVNRKYFDINVNLSWLTLNFTHYNKYKGHHASANLIGCQGVKLFLLKDPFKVLL